MILRKLADAIHKQNWFTVVLEILIVVIAIFIGLQADAWNQSRLDDQRAQKALEELQFDFVVIGDVAKELAVYYKDIIDDLQILIRNSHLYSILDCAGYQSGRSGYMGAGKPPGSYHIPRGALARQTVQV